MATVNFESTPYKRTVFYTADYSNVSGSTATTLSDGTGLVQAKLVNEEVDKAVSEVTLRTYELYIDETSDAEKGTVDRIARTTKDNTKTYADGYDLYISSEPTAGNTVESSGDLSFVYLNGDTNPNCDVRVVYVTEYEG